MKNITFSADEKLIEQARKTAEEKHTTLNEEFRLWLASYAKPEDKGERIRRALERIGDSIRVSGPFTRDQMNERGPIPEPEEERRAV